MHRLGLSESMLLFAEHRLFLDETPAMTVTRFRRRQPEKKLVVEIANIEEAMLWADAELLQREKFTPANVAACRAFLDQRGLHPVLAAAGGIHAGNAADSVHAGADMLVTSAPYIASPLDVLVNFFKPAMGRLFAQVATVLQRQRPARWPRITVDRTNPPSTNRCAQSASWGGVSDGRPRL